MYDIIAIIILKCKATGKLVLNFVCYFSLALCNIN